MMIGARERVRSSRQTSMPESRGSITSRSTRSGCTASKSSIASTPSRATRTRKPSRLRPTTRASMNDSSSSTTSTVGGSGTTSLLRTHAVQCHRAGSARQAKHEGRTLSFTGLDLHISSVVARDMSHDRQSESGTTGVPGPGPVHPVEPFENSFQVSTRNTDPVVGHCDVDPAIVLLHSHLHRRTVLGVLDRVVDKVVHG